MSRLELELVGAYMRMKIEQHGFAIDDTSKFGSCAIRGLGLKLILGYSKSNCARPKIYQGLLSVRLILLLYFEVRYVERDAWIRRALCYLSILRPQQAVADFKKVVQLDPKNANAKTQLDATVKV